MEWCILKITLYYKGRALKSFGDKTQTFYSNPLLSFKKIPLWICHVCMKWWDTLKCILVQHTQKVSCLSPSRGDSRLSPVTVVRIVRHCGRILGQARALGRISNGVEPCFPQWCTLPHPTAPLFLSTLQTTAAAPVHSVYLRRTKEFRMCNWVCF